MEIWGVQIPIDYVVVGGQALIVAAVLVSSRLRRFLLHRAKSRAKAFRVELNAANAQAKRIEDEVNALASALFADMARLDDLSPFDAVERETFLRSLERVMDLSTAGSPDGA